MGYGQASAAGWRHELQAEQRQGHRQALSPALFRSMEMLAMPSCDLRSFLQSAVDDNVMLTLDSGAFDGAESVSFDDEQERNRLAGEAVSRERGSRQHGLYDDGRLSGAFLQRQLSLSQYLLCQCTPADEAVFLEVAECLDERGYFQGDAEAIAFSMECSQQAVEDELQLIRTLEPRGVGAENLRDCLLLQLDRDDANYELLCRLVRERLDDLPTLRGGSVACMYGVTREEGARLLKVLRSLDPWPGRPFARAESACYIVPDIVISRASDGGFAVALSLSETAGLSIDEDYRRLSLLPSLGGEVKGYLDERHRQAAALLRDVAFRHRVLSGLAAYVVVRQRRFFESQGALVDALSVRDAADELGVHPSTVSRAIAGKTMRTPFGIFPLSVFFRAGVTGCEPDDADAPAEAVATYQVKTAIRRMVEGEDRCRPLSDNALRQALVAKGVKIERRTVAKYRESLGIPCSTDRRRMYGVCR